MSVQRVVAVLFILILATASTTSIAAPSSSEEKTEESKVDKATEHYNKGLEHAEAGNFEKALKEFERADKERKNDPEILNMMAFSNRKLGKLDEAFKIYEKALGVRPDFPQAREYLGEAHIQAALEQVRILRGYGAAGEEELRKLLSAFAEAAFRLGLGHESRSGGAERKW